MEGHSAPSKKLKITNGRDNYEYCINGVNVNFPVKAYPTQITMMNKILQGLERKHNCLLESPTGSGKSLALLCSCLSWQAAEKKRIDSAATLVANDSETALLKNGDSLKHSVPSKTDDTSTKRHISPQNNMTSSKDAILKTRSGNPVSHKSDDFPITNFDGDDDDFIPSKGMKLRNNSKITYPDLCNQYSTKGKKGVRNGNIAYDEDVTKSTIKKNGEAPSWNMEIVRPVCSNEESSPNEGAKKRKENSSDKVPKIYFGTRTHKQISQIVGELKKTIYRHVKMSILGSREYLCIHPKVSKGKDKNEECKKLIKGFEGKSCKYNTNSSLFARLGVRQKYSLDVAWDIEDLVIAGKKLKACPYFGSREMTKGAEIIFCPYNYLINPLIRSQMMINLKEQVVVLDEAHNIEDSAREAASVNLTALQIEETKDDLLQMTRAGIMVDAHTCLTMLCDGLLAWIDSVKDQLHQRGFENEVKVWSGKEIVEMLHQEEKLRLSPASYKIYEDQLQILITAEQEANNPTFGEHELRINTKSLACLSSLMLVLGKLLDQDNDFADDYKVALCRTSVLEQGNSELPGGWMKKNRYPEKVWTYRLNLWCLNPAVVFSELDQQARSIILTSGTLSPMTSFSSELGVKFPITLEANHVIADNQVWVGSLSVGPDNKPINASYKFAETFAFQDSVGNVLLHICKVIPKGVLCFFPSYSMLGKLEKRWKGTNLWNELSLCKVVLSEPRASEKQEFNQILNFYYDSVKATVNSKLNGALLLAVCRGKVSEGIDFSDDNARAVLTVGIPFPNFKDTQVELKKKYNNRYRVERGLLSGNEWYEIQAFRALNQALGRCIRHKNDWGALLMIDERFAKSPKYRNGLSKWVRSKLQHFSDFQVCISSLCQFSDSMIKSMFCDRDINDDKNTLRSVDNDSNCTPLSTRYNTHFSTSGDDEKVKHKKAHGGKKFDMVKAMREYDGKFNITKSCPIEKLDMQFKDNDDFDNTERFHDNCISDTSTPIKSLKDGIKRRYSFRNCSAKRLQQDDMIQAPQDKTMLNNASKTCINKSVNDVKRQFLDSCVDNLQPITMNDSRKNHCMKRNFSNLVDFEDMSAIPDEEMSLLSTQVLSKDLSKPLNKIHENMKDLGAMSDEVMSLSTQVIRNKQNLNNSLNEKTEVNSNFKKKSKFMYPPKGSTEIGEYCFHVNKSTREIESCNIELNNRKYIAYELKSQSSMENLNLEETTLLDLEKEFCDGTSDNAVFQCSPTLFSDPESKLNDNDTPKFSQLPIEVESFKTGDNKSEVVGYVSNGLRASDDTKLESSVVAKDSIDKSVSVYSENHQITKGILSRSDKTVPKHSDCFNEENNMFSASDPKQIVKEKINISSKNCKYLPIESSPKEKIKSDTLPSNVSDNKINSCNENCLKYSEAVPKPQVALDNQYVEHMKDRINISNKSKFLGSSDHETQTNSSSEINTRKLGSHNDQIMLSSLDRRKSSDVSIDHGGMNSNCSNVIKSQRNLSQFLTKKVNTKLSKVYERKIDITTSSKTDSNYSEILKEKALNQSDNVLTELKNNSLNKDASLIDNSLLGESVRANISMNSPSKRLSIRRKSISTNLRKNFRIAKKQNTSIISTDMNGEDFEELIDDLGQGQPSLRCTSCSTIFLEKGCKKKQTNLDENIRDKLGVREEHVYEVDQCNGLTLRKESDIEINHEKFTMNAYYDDGNNSLYLPLICKLCSTKLTSDCNRNIMGMKVMTWNKQKKTKTYLFSDTSL